MSGLRRHLPALLGAALFLSVALTMAMRARGTVEMDEVTHFLQARYAPRHPFLYASAWARPLFLFFYTLPAQTTFAGTRAFNVLIAALAAWVAYLLASDARLQWPALALLTTAFQLRYIQQSFTVMTEHLGALIIVLAILLWRRARRELSCFLIALLPLTRPEGALLGPLWFLMVWLEPGTFLSHRLRRTAILCMGFALWILISLATTGDPIWFLHNFPSPWQHRGVMSAGRALVYLHRFPQFASWPIALLFIIGIPLLRRHGLGLAAATTAVVIVLHSALRAGEIFGSTGYLRYLVPVSPLIGVAACAGWGAMMRAAAQVVPRASRAVTAGLLLLVAASYAYSWWRYPVYAPGEAPGMRQLTCIERSLAGTTPPGALVYTADYQYYLIDDRDPWDFHMDNSHLLRHIRNDQLQLREILPELAAGTIVICDPVWMMQYMGCGESDLRMWGYVHADEAAPQCANSPAYYRLYRKQSAAASEDSEILQRDRLTLARRGEHGGIGDVDLSWSRQHRRPHA